MFFIQKLVVYLLHQNNIIMKTYYIYYWLFKNDEWQDFETEITAIRFEDAYSEFKDKYRLSKIQEMKLITK